MREDDSREADASDPFGDDDAADSLADESEAVFSVLGDETRLRILLELASRADPEQASKRASFSELRRAVGVEDAGRFNYHLDKLQDTFVVKAPAEDGAEAGYRPTVAGLGVASSIHAGRYDRGAEVQTAATEYDCPACGGTLEARYENEVVVLACAEDHTLFSFPVPAGAAADRSVLELLDVATLRASMNVELARNDLCPRCWGSTSIDVLPADDFFDGLDQPLPRAIVDCDRCWLSFTLPAPQVVGRSPPVVAFYHAHDLAPERAILSALTVLASADVTLTDESPPRVELTIELDGDELALEMAADGEILSYEASIG